MKLRIILRIQAEFQATLGYIIELCLKKSNILVMSLEKWHLFWWTVSQHPYGSSQTFLSPVPGNQHLALGGITHTGGTQINTKIKTAVSKNKWFF